MRRAALLAIMAVREKQCFNGARQHYWQPFDGFSTMPAPLLARPSVRLSVFPFACVCLSEFQQQLNQFSAVCCGANWILAMAAAAAPRAD